MSYSLKFAIKLKCWAVLARVLSNFCTVKFCQLLWQQQQQQQAYYYYYYYYYYCHYHHHIHHHQCHHHHHHHHRGGHECWLVVGWWWRWSHVAGWHTRLTGTRGTRYRHLIDLTSTLIDPQKKTSWSGSDLMKSFVAASWTAGRESNLRSGLSSTNPTPPLPLRLALLSIYLADVSVDCKTSCVHQICWIFTTDIGTSAGNSVICPCEYMNTCSEYATK